MTTEQKLKLFVQTVLGTVTQKKDALIKEYEQELITDLEKKKSDYQAYLDTTYHQKQATAVLESNRQVSMELASLKQKLALATTDAANLVFSQVTKELGDYKKTAAYQDYLESLVQEITEFAGKEQVKIYLDPSDESFLSKGLAQTDANLLISSHDFGGGLQAEIPSKNLFIDESFESKINEARDTFVLQ